MKHLVCLSHTPWRASPTRTQQLITRLRDVNVLFFEPPADRGSRLHHQSGRLVRPNIMVYTLPPRLDERLDVPFLQRRTLSRSARFISQVLQKHRFREPALWLTSPEQVFFIELLPHAGLIYDCHQEWDELPLDWESLLAARADVVFAASPGLVRRLAPCCDNIALIPNGVNYLMFARPDLAPPPLLSERTGPVLGRIGSVTSDLELEPLLYAADRRPDWTFLLLGQVAKGPKKQLSLRPNILMPGEIPMVDVPDWLSGCQVCFDLLSRWGKGSDILPPRLYEYLAVGRPVVLMLVPDQVEPLPDVVYTAASPAAFLRRCERALQEDPGWVGGRRRAYAEDGQWAHRAEEIQRILETAALF